MKLAVSSNPKKYILFFVPLVFLALALNIVGWQIAIGVALFCIFYVTASKSAWWLIVLAPLGLIFGTILHLEVRPNWIYEISISEIFVMAAFATLVLDIVFGFRPQGMRVTTIGWWLVLYTALALASVFYVSDYELYVAGLKVLVLSIMAYIAAMNLLDNKSKVSALLVSLTIFAGILSLQIFYLFFQTGFSPAIFFDRAAIRFPFGPLALVVATICFLLPLVFSARIENKNNHKLGLLSFLAFTVGAVAVFVSLGKAAIVSFCIGLIYLFWRFKSQRIIMTLSVVFFLLISVTLLSPYVEGVWERFSRFSLDTTTTFRMDEYKVVQRIITDNPILGLGVGEQLNEYRRLLNPDYGQLASSFIIQAAMDLGLIGTAIYMAMLISIIVLLFRLNKKRRRPLVTGLIGSAIVVGINGLFETTLFAFQFAIVFWIVIGLASRLDKDKTLYESTT